MQHADAGVRRFWKKNFGITIRKPRKRRPWNRGLRMTMCMDCDGCGWVEGGDVLQTMCSTCKGKGKVWER